MGKGRLALTTVLIAASLVTIPTPANALTAVTATGTNPAICNQSGLDLGAATGDVTAERLVTGDCLIKFLTVKADYSWSRPVGVTTIKVFVVGGGGGSGAGGSRAGTSCAVNANDRVGGGGGGGGGGQVREDTLTIASPTNISIAVGSGGAGGAVGGCGQAGGTGSNGGSSSVATLIALGGNGGGGGTNDGAGGSGGSTRNSSGTTLSGSSRPGSGDCSDAASTGCFVAGGGAGAGGAAATITGTAITTSGGSGGVGVAPALVTLSGTYGGGGGGGNRHTQSSPLASRTGGSATGGGGAGIADGAGTAGTTNTGGGGGGGRANGSTAANNVNAPPGATGGSGIVAIQYTPTSTSVVNAPSISGSIYKGINSTISVSIEITGVVRFFANGKRISTCLTRVTSGSYPNNVATCNWKPSFSGRNILTATLTPSNNLFSPSTSSPVVFNVLNRSSTR
jgi:hypothetical protein